MTETLAPTSGVDLTAPAEVPFHRPDIDEDDVAGVVEVLRSGWITTGARCRAFEEAFADHLGGGVEALAVNSCTSALHLALEALGVGPGDYVLTSPYTFTATAEVIRYLGAHPLFADVDPVTGNLTAATVDAAVGRLSPAVARRIKVLLPVHFAGLPCDMTSLRSLADEHGWAIVDDAAHALPAKHQGVPVGRWGDITAFSFYATKTLCTGEGGMVVTASREAAARMRVMRLHGISHDVFDRYSRSDSWRYEVVAPGYKYNLTDMAAALGLSQLRRLQQMSERRRAVVERYQVELAGVGGLELPPEAPPGDEHAWHLYALRVAGGAGTRDRLVRELAACGIGTSVHFIPLHLQPYYRSTYQLRPEDLPGATALFTQEISLPVFPGMTTSDVSRVTEAVPEALARARGR